MNEQNIETDTERFLEAMHCCGSRAIRGSAWISFDAEKKSTSPAILFPFTSISVLIVLMSLFVMSFDWGGWSWSSWTYALSFIVLVPLVLLESARRVIITGGGFIILFLTVLVDAGMPRYFGYSLADYNLYDKFAHFAGAATITLFLWAVTWWTLSPAGPSKTERRRILLITIVIVIVASTLFKSTEYLGDFLYGLKNTHGYVDTVSDLIFNVAGIAAAAIVISRHNYSVLRRPFWYAED